MMKEFSDSYKRSTTKTLKNDRFKEKFILNKLNTS